jgi:hypothetical protein
LSARDGEEINHRVQSAPRPLPARCETFGNQQRKDVKAKQHWYLINVKDEAEFKCFGEWSGDPDQDEK